MFLEVVDSFPAEEETNIPISQSLIGKTRPCDQRHACRDGLQSGIPSTVAQESTNRAVCENLLLGSPLADYQPTPTHTLLKT
jgi:hypothetical protein